MAVSIDDLAIVKSINNIGGISQKKARAVLFFCADNLPGDWLSLALPALRYNRNNLVLLSAPQNDRQLNAFPLLLQTIISIISC